MTSQERHERGGRVAGRETSVDPSERVCRGAESGDSSASRSTPHCPGRAHPDKGSAGSTPARDAEIDWDGGDFEAAVEALRTLGALDKQRKAVRR
jgi:hypothetical protein